jgi:hypothetical protein
MVLLFTTIGIIGVDINIYVFVTWMRCITTHKRVLELKWDMKTTLFEQDLI